MDVEGTQVEQNYVLTICILPHQTFSNLHQDPHFLLIIILIIYLGLLFSY